MYTTVSVKRGSRRLSVATSICPSVLLGGVGGDGSAGDGADSAGGATGSAGRAAGPIPTEVARTISSVTGGSHVTALFLCALPILRVAREHGLAPGRLRRTVERVRGGPPRGVMGRGPVCLKRRLVFVDFVEVVRVRVAFVLEHVEAITPGFVALGAERVLLDRRQKARTPRRLHANLDPDREHDSASSGERTAEELPGQGTRGLAVAQNRLAVDDRRGHAPATLYQTLGASRKIGGDLGHLRPDRLGIEDDEVTGHPLTDEATVGEAPERGGHEREHPAGVSEGGWVMAENPSGRE